MTERITYSFNVDSTINDEIVDILERLEFDLGKNQVNRSTLLLDLLKRSLTYFDYDQYIKEKELYVDQKTVLITGRNRGKTLKILQDILEPNKLYTSNLLTHMTGLSKKTTRDILRGPGFTPVEKGPHGVQMYRYNPNFIFSVTDLDDLLKNKVKRTQEDVEEFNRYYNNHLSHRSGYIEVGLQLLDNLHILYQSLIAELGPNKLKYLTDLDYFHLTHETLVNTTAAEKRKDIISLKNAIEIMDDLISFNPDESDPHIIGNINGRINWSPEDAKKLFELEYLIYMLDNSSPNIEYVDKPTLPINDQLKGFYNKPELSELSGIKETVYSPSILEAITSLRYGGIYEVRYDLKKMRKTFKTYGTLKLLSEQNWRIKEKIAKLKEIPLRVSSIQYDPDFYLGFMDKFYSATHYRLPYNRLGMQIVDKKKTATEAKDFWSSFVKDGLFATLLETKDFIEAVDNLIVMNPAYDPFIEAYEVDMNFGRVTPHAFGRFYLGELYDQLCSLFSTFLNIPKALVPVWYQQRKMYVIDNLDYDQHYFNKS